MTDQCAQKDEDDVLAGAHRVTIMGNTWRCECGASGGPRGGYSVVEQGGLHRMRIALGFDE